MSVWYEQISEEGLRWAAIVDGGRVNPCHEHFMANSREEARAWVDAAYIRKTTPKVKKPAEPVFVSELDDLVAVADEGLPHDGGQLLADYGAGLARASDNLEYNALQNAGSGLTGGLYAPAAPEAAETATGDLAGSVEAPKRRGRPPKVSA